MIKNKIFTYFIWFLPIIFAFHNLEELISLQKYSFVVSDRFPLLSELYHLRTLTMAMILLTLVVAVILLLEFYKHTKITFYLSLYCLCLLLINGISHIIQFFVFQRYNPGLVTALILLVPYIVYYLYELIRTAKLTKGMLVRYLLISMITMGPIILLFLLISKGILKYIA